MQERCKLGFFSSAPSRLAMHEVYTKISASLAKIDEPQIKRHKRSSPSTACCSMAFMPICLVFLFWAANAGNTACLSFDCIRFNKTQWGWCAQSGHQDPMSSCPIWILASSNEIRRCIGVQTPDIPRSWGQISQSEVEFGETVRHMLAGHGRTTLELRNEEEDEGDEIVYPFSHPRPWDVDRALWRFFSFSLWNEIVSFGTCFVQVWLDKSPNLRHADYAQPVSD